MKRKEKMNERDPKKRKNPARIVRFETGDAHCKHYLATGEDE